MKRAVALVLASLAVAATAQDAAAPAPATKSDEPLFSELNEAEWQSIPKPMLKVLCAPDAVQPGEDYYVTFEWWSAMKRPLVIHLDLLNADTKEWLAGDEVEVTGASGKVATRIVVPHGIEHKTLKWNAYMSPQDEKWPNALVTTNFEAQIGQRTTLPCAPLRNFVRPSKGVPEFNYVVVTDYPTGFRAGAPQEVTVQYNLLPGAEPSYVSASLLRNSDNSVVAHAQAKAEEGEHTAKLRFDVPMEAGTEPVHILATIKEEGKSFHARMAEDRVWSTSVYYARKNNLRG